MSSRLASKVIGRHVHTVKIAEVRRLLHLNPFRPFVIHIADGGRLKVQHEDFVAVAPSGRELIVYLREDDYQVVDVLMITRLEVVARNGSRKTPR